MSEIDAEVESRMAQTDAPRSAPAAPPGWYVISGGQHRYWDGSEWAGAGASQPGDAPSIEPAPSVRRQRVSRRLRLGIIFGIIGVVVLGVVVSVVAVQIVTRSTTFTATGIFDLEDTQDGSACLPHAGYQDIAQGTPVDISVNGKTVASGSLGPGTSIKHGLTCQYSFSIAGVPRGDKSYGVEVSHRGVIKYSASDMVHGNVALVLGH